MRWPGDRRLRRLALVVALGVAAAACGADEAPDRPVVEVFGNLVGERGRAFAEVLRDVGADAGVELRYVGVTSFVEQLTDRLDAGDPPDVALLAQPGVLADLDQRGVLEPLPSELADQSASDVPAGLVELVTIDGVPAALWVSVDVKGLVWYPPSLFADLGLTVPSSLDELAALSDRLRTGPEGVAPWCVTVEAGASTGWVGTDWVEAYLARRLGPAAYDRWTTGELRFDDPAVVAVFEELDAVLRQPGALAGGTRAVLTTPWERAAEGLIADPARCAMVLQADFLRNELPPGTRVGPDGDVDVFVLPPAEPGAEPPFVLGGLLAAPLGSGPEVDAALAVLGSAELGTELVVRLGLISPHVEVDPAAADDELVARLVELVRSADVVRFDGSDLMPPSVGTGSFWAGMRAFFAREALESVIATIEAGWPQPVSR